MDLFESLLSHSSGSRVHAETLEMLGRKASQMFRQQGIPLNQAVAQLVSQHPELGNEHVKRVVEFANTVTFQELFQSSDDKNVHFDVADPGVVLRDIKDGGSPAHDGKTLSGGMGDYAAPANAWKDGIEGGDQMLANAFDPAQDNPSGDESHGLQKMAGIQDANLQHGYSNPIEDVYDTHLRLEGARSELVRANEHFDLMLKEAHADLYRVIKAEVTSPDGAGLGGVTRVLEKIATDRCMALNILRPMIEKLATEGLSKDMLAKSIEKRAGVVVNLQHPLVKVWGGLVKIANEKARTELALSELDGHLAQTVAFLKSAGVGFVAGAGLLAGAGTVAGAATLSNGLKKGREYKAGFRPGVIETSGH